MALSKIKVMYGHLEGTEGKFARDPSGFIAIDAGIFAKHGLDVSWEHVQGTEERYQRLEKGSAQLSLVVGRASLQHFLHARTTRLLGCAMNSCPYYLLVAPSIRRWADLKDNTIVCREGPARNTPLREALRRETELELDRDLRLDLPPSDQGAFHALVNGAAQAALLPRPYGFLAEEKGFRRISDWPDIVDDPLPITLETTENLIKERGNEFALFLAAYREGIRYLKSRRSETSLMLQARFHHSPALAAKTLDDYLVFMDERLLVDFTKFRQLLSQMAPEPAGDPRQIASDWVVPGALSD